MAESCRGDDDATREEETSSRIEEEKRKKGKQLVGYDKVVREEGGKSSGKDEKTKRHVSVISLARARTASKSAGLFSLDPEKLMRGLHKGVLLHDNKVKFWIDEKHHQNCFMLLAKTLSIIWGEDSRYWDHISYQEDCFRGPIDIEVATLKEVCWLDISGSLTSVELSPLAPYMLFSPMANYEVMFELMMTRGASGWDKPVNLALVLPDGTTQGRMENLKVKAEGEWFQIPFGEFVATQENIGDIRFSLSEHGTHWKGGLHVKGVIFRPKY